MRGSLFLTILLLTSKLNVWLGSCLISQGGTEYACVGRFWEAEN